MTESQAPAGYVSLSDVQQMIKDALEQDRQEHEQQLSAVRALIPRAQVPAHSGGPGVDHHQESWSLAEQEAAQRGEVLDHWT